MSGVGGGRRVTSLASREGQMTVELAVITPVVIVVALVVLNLMGFVEACAAFDQVALDAVVAHGVAPSGEQSEGRAASEVRSAIEELLGREGRCEVEVRAEAVGMGATSSGLVMSPLLSASFKNTEPRSFMPADRNRLRYFTSAYNCCNHAGAGPCLLGTHAEVDLS